MKKKKNFLVFIVDQMQWKSLGCNGNKDVKTPNIDKLAKEGVTFQRAYCANPVCTPSRSSIITGLLPRQHGCVTNGRNLDMDIPTIGKVLSDNGYKTHSVGKLHYQPYIADEVSYIVDGAYSYENKQLWDDGTIKKLPEGYYGFETSDYLGGHGRYCFGEYIEWLNNKSKDARDLYQKENAYYNFKNVWKMPIDKELHYNSWIVEKTNKYLDELNEDDNFFLWCSFPDPHTPFAACKPYSEMYDKNSLELPESWDKQEYYFDHLKARRDKVFSKKHGDKLSEEYIREVLASTYGMITHIDDSIGEIVNKLEEKGMKEDTVILFMADHGEYLGAHNLVYKGPWQLEETIRVPFIISSNKAEERVCQDVVSLVDIVPTILEYTGIGEEAFDTRGLRNHTTPYLPGRSLMKYVENGEEIEKRPALVESDEDYFGGKLYRSRVIIDGKYKLTIYPNNGGGVLIDLEKDPCELNNLYYNEDYLEIKSKITEKMLFEFIKHDRMDNPRIATP